MKVDSLVSLVVLTIFIVVETHGATDHTIEMMHHHHYVPHRNHNNNDKIYINMKAIKQYEAWLWRMKARWRRQQENEEMTYALQDNNILVTSNESPTTLTSKMENININVNKDMLIRVERILTVNQMEDSGDFKTIQEAVNVVPQGNTQRVIIKIAAGVYE